MTDEPDLRSVILTILTTAALLAVFAFAVLSPEVTHRRPAVAHCLSANGGYFFPCRDLQHFGET